MAITTTNKIGLDLWSEKLVVVNTKQGDASSRYINVSVTDHSVSIKLASSNTAILAIKQGDETIVTEGNVQGDGTVTFLIPLNAVTDSGIKNAEIRLYENKALVSTMPFKIRVVQSISTDNEVQGDTTETIIQQVLGEMRSQIGGVSLNTDDNGHLVVTKDDKTIDLTNGNLATVDGETASKNYKANDGYVVYKGEFYKIIKDIVQGDAFTPNTNIKRITVGDEFAKKIPSDILSDPTMQTLVLAGNKGITFEDFAKYIFNTYKQTFANKEQSVKEAFDSALYSVTEDSKTYVADGTGNKIYPMTNADNVSYDDTTTVKDKIDAIESKEVDISNKVKADLVTTETGYVLDATMGKELNDKITETNTKVADTSTKINSINEKLTEMSGDEDILITIGDSYGQGWMDDTKSNYETPWVNFIAQKLDKKENKTWFNHCEGGSGFIPTGQKGNTFLTGLQTITVPDASKVKMIIVMGGRNEANSVDETKLTSAIKAFGEYVETTYPNAQIYIGMCGWSRTPSINSNLIKVAYCYQNAYKNAIYLSGIENVLINSSRIENTGNHPSKAGYEALNYALYNALTTGYATDIVLHLNGRVTFEDDSNPEFSCKVQNQDAVISFPSFYCTLKTVRAFHGNTAEQIGTIDMDNCGALFTNANDIIQVPTPVVAKYADGTYRNAPGFLEFTNGKVYIRSFTLSDDNKNYSSATIQQLRIPQTRFKINRLFQF